MMLDHRTNPGITTDPITIHLSENMLVTDCYINGKQVELGPNTRLECEKDDTPNQLEPDKINNEIMVV